MMASSAHKTGATSGRMFWVVLAVSLCLSACAALPPDRGAPGRKPAPPAPEDFVAPERAISYRCDDGRMLTMTLYGAESGTLKIGGAATEMRAVRAASGAKFESADRSITFWTKGNEAMINNGQGADMTCRVAE
jgi:membrane-bound inhibitor of C-type lysozyme